MKRTLKLLYLSLAMLLPNIFSIVHAQVNLEDLPHYNQDVSGVWRQVAPGMAGSNRAIYTDAVDPLKVWVAPDMGNDYLSNDGGKHWESIIPFDGVWNWRNTLSDECVMSDFKDNNIVLNLRQKDIQFSTNGGKSFSTINDYASGEEPNSVWYTAAAHPTEGGTWYVANGLANRYLRTGVNTNPLTNIDVNQPKVWKITNITTNSRTIEAVSDNGMDAQSAVFDLFCHPDTENYPEMLFAATSTGFYRKDNASAAWLKISAGCSRADFQWDGSVLSVFVLKQTTYQVVDNILLSDGGVFKSTTPEIATLNSGWLDKTEGLHIDLSTLDINKTHYRSMVKAWFGYSNGEEELVGIPESYLHDYADIICDPTDPNKVYMSVWGGTIAKLITGSVWASKDGGNSWYAALRPGNGFTNDAYWKDKQPEHLNKNVEIGVHDKKFPDFVNYGKRGVRSMAIAVDGTLYASAIKGYLTIKYNADEDEWLSLDNTQDGDLFYGHGNANTGAFSVVPDIHRPGEMFLLQYEASAYKSTTQTHPDYPGIVGVKRVPELIDIGPKWAPGQPILSPSTLASHPTDPNIFYYMSTRTGDISKCTVGETEHEIMGEPIEVPNTTIVSNMKCAYWSDLRIASDGKTMYAIAEIIDTDNRPMGQVKIFNPDSQKGIYKSNDEGRTWMCMNSGLPKTAGGRNASGLTRGNNSASVKALIMDPSDEDCLYAAVKRYRAPAGESGWVEGGLYRTANASAQWSEILIPEGIKSLWDVWIHTNDGMGSKIFIAGGGESDVSNWGEGGVWVADYKANGNYTVSDWQKIFEHPFASIVRTSPNNAEHILVVTRESTGNSKKDAGTFYSLSGGSENNNSAWTKFNTGRGSMMIGAIAFDTGNPNRVWCSCESSGTYTALINTSKIGEVDSIAIKQIDTNVELNKKINLNCNVYPLGITPITPMWKSLNEDIATVSNTGEVTLLKEDKVGIVAFINKGDEVISDTCWINPMDNGIASHKYETIQLYPNPVTGDKLHFSNSSYSNNYTIYNASGNPIVNGFVNSNSIDVSALIAGMYYIIIDNKRLVKFIKV
ncbi:T9SS type A sorting domain-containing protein [Saccharicrinis aurantiacus]|uniref:T9SS type A sorting domain-containing protein n=1 Tax=Saccharicrinis aurantiacus TaxID=1849719 RepID=UPI002493A023|nr:T9SS type A sorting domain-containing protein [Saccharicrinis aurantiacus]